MPPQIRFTHWSDPLCIWAFVKQDPLEKVLAQHGDAVSVSYRVLPLFGSIPYRFREGEWAEDGPEGRAAETRQIAEKHGHPEVSGEVWLSDPPASSWPAGAAIKAAFELERQERLPPGKAAAYQWELRRRFFVDNANIARRCELLGRAEALHIPRELIERRLDDGTAYALLWEDWRESQEKKLLGSPTFVFAGGRAQLYGDFEPGVLEATVAELLREAA